MRDLYILFLAKLKKQFADSNHIPYFEVSAFKREGVKEAFSALIQKVYENKLTNKKEIK